MKHDAVTAYLIAARALTERVLTTVHNLSDHTTFVTAFIDDHHLHDMPRRDVVAALRDLEAPGVRLGGGTAVVLDLVVRWRCQRRSPRRVRMDLPAAVALGDAELWVRQYAREVRREVTRGLVGAELAARRHAKVMSKLTPAERTNVLARVDILTGR